MHQFQHEVQKKEKIDKIYVILFIISVLINLVLFFINGSIFRGIVSLLCLPIILHYFSRKKVWAGFIVKFMVWMHIVLLLLMFLAMILLAIK